MSILFTVHQEYASIWNNRRQQKFLHANKNKHDILEFDIRKSCWEFIYYQYPYIISVKNIHELFYCIIGCTLPSAGKVSFSSSASYEK